MYADKITDSMRKTIEETSYRRKKQKSFNIENGITPKQMDKSFSNTFNIENKSISNSYEKF